MNINIRTGQYGKVFYQANVFHITITVRLFLRVHFCLESPWCYHLFDVKLLYFTHIHTARKEKTS